MEWGDSRVRWGDDEGFSLIELMVVVLIIAILIAIAIPTFLGARRRAQDRAAQSSLRNTVTAAKAIFTDDETYTDADATALASGETSISFIQGGTSFDPLEVVIVVNSGNRFVAKTLSKGGKCWYVQDVASNVPESGTRWAMDDTNITKSTGCGGAPPPAQDSPGWVRDPNLAQDI